MRRYTFFPLLLLLAAFVAGCNPPTGDTRERIGRLTAGEKANQATTDAKPYQIVVIPQQSDAAFLQAAQQGTQDAAAKFNANIIWYPPGPAENEVLRQKQTVEKVVAQKVDGIVLAPADATELVIPVNRAAKARIPIAIFDADVNTKNKLSLIATNNFESGVLSAQHIGRIIDSHGIVAILALSASPSIAERARGFEELMAQEFPQIEVLHPDDSSAEKLLAQNSKVTAIFCLDESTTLSALQTVRDKKLKGKIKIVGFGSARALTEALKTGELDALVQPNAYKMGYESVKAVVDHLQLRDVARRIDIGVELLIRENVDTRETKSG